MKIPTTVLFIGIAGAVTGCAHTSVNDSGSADAEVTVIESNIPTSDTPSHVRAKRSIGVAACDDYLAKLEACIAFKFPEEGTREEMYRAMDQMRDGWTALDIDKTALAEACKNAMEMTRDSYRRLGCEF